MIINTNDLVDPTYEGRHLDVDAGHLGPPAPETPRNQTGKLVVAVDFTNQRTATISLTGVVAVLPAGTKAAGRKDEQFLGDRVDFA